MAVSIRYEEEGRIVVWVFEGSWTWEEYYEKRDAVNAAVRASAHQVDMIIDMTKSKLLPKNLMSHARSAVRVAPPNIGKTVFVGSNAILHAFFKVFNRLYGVVQPNKEISYFMVTTLDEAYAILRRKETSP